MGETGPTRLRKLRPTWDALLAEFLLVKQAQGRSERTIKDYKCHINRFLRHYPDIKPTNFRALRRAVLEYLAAPVAPATRNLRIAYLRSFFRWCVEEGHLPEDPTAGVCKARTEEKVRHITLEEVKRILEQIDCTIWAGLRDYCLIVLLLDTGIRPREALRLLPQDINLEAREVYVRATVAKTRKPRTLIISPHVAQLLARFLAVRPSDWEDDVPVFATETGHAMEPDWWARRFKKYCQKAGVEATPYALRHTFAIEFLRAGSDPFALQRILGHTTLDMTRRYIQLTTEDLHREHERCSPVTALLGESRPRAPRKLK